jgi:hypothetical protein
MNTPCHHKQSPLKPRQHRLLHLQPTMLTSPTRAAGWMSIWKSSLTCTSTHASGRQSLGLLPQTASTPDSAGRTPGCPGPSSTASAPPDGSAAPGSLHSAPEVTPQPPHAAACDPPLTLEVQERVEVGPAGGVTVHHGHDVGPDRPGEIRVLLHATSPSRPMREPPGQHEEQRPRARAQTSKHCRKSASSCVPMSDGLASLLAMWNATAASNDLWFKIAEYIMFTNKGSCQCTRRVKAHTRRPLARRTHPATLHLSVLPHHIPHLVAAIILAGTRGLILHKAAHDPPIRPLLPILLPRFCWRGYRRRVRRHARTEGGGRAAPVLHGRLGPAHVTAHHSPT